MFLPKKWNIPDFFYLYLNKKLKYKQIIDLIDKYDSLPSFSMNTQNDVFFNDNSNSKQLSEEIISNCEKKSVQLISYWDDRYPKLLRNISSPPLVLYVDGELGINHQNLISIVGTRSNTLYGKLTTEKFVECFVQNSVGIVSGLAFGIDSIAHKKACDLGGKTYAVVASGVDMLSSAMSEKIAIKIKENGGSIISEYPCGTPAQTYYFPVRNRIISGVSPATLVIESGIKSGTLITAKFAFEQDREVYAIPGNINAEKSKGCNYLIKNNQAILCTDPEQIMLDLGWKLIDNEVKNSEIKLENKNEILLYTVIDHEPKQIDIIADQAELDISQVMVGLLNLEFKGLIRQLPGKNFIKV
jgi:DNA processing protein